MNTKQKPGFLGAGFRWPLNVDEGRGVALSSAERNIAQAIRLLLGTRPGERRRRPGFGCRIHEFVFAPNNLQTRQSIRDAVLQSLIRWERRIEDISVDVTTDPRDIDHLEVDIRYKIRTTNSAYNLVYPFYLQGS